MIDRPSPEALAAFGLREALLPFRLPGGQGVAWRAGDVVLKPTADIQEAEWSGSVLSRLREVGFRVSRPIRSSVGTWTAAGWSAWSWVEGRHDFSDRWSDVLTAGAAFHAALRDVERPSFLDVREGVWSVGDLAAWGDDSPIVIHDEFGPALEELLALRSPSRLPSQVIHGDLTGNVLFADPAAPAIIDFVPYWRPADFALAIVVADAVAWHHAAPELARALPSAEDPRSMLARAAIYRLITSDRAAAEFLGADPTYVKNNVEAHDRILRVLRTM